MLGGGAAITNQTDYDSNYEMWGIVGVLRLVGDAPTAWFYHVGIGKQTMLLAVLAATLWAVRRRVDVISTGVAVSALFLLFTPGFGIQYLIFPAVMVLSRDLWFGLYFHAAAGAFAACVYLWFLDSFYPIQSVFFGPFAMPAALIGVVAWALLIPIALRALVPPPRSVSTDS